MTVSFLIGVDLRVISTKVLSLSIIKYLKTFEYGTGTLRVWYNTGTVLYGYDTRSVRFRDKFGETAIKKDKKFVEI